MRGDEYVGGRGDERLEGHPLLGHRHLERAEPNWVVPIVGNLGVRCEKDMEILIDDSQINRFAIVKGEDNITHLQRAVRTVSHENRRVRCRRSGARFASLQLELMLMAIQIQE